jgi:hypothetical protein
MSQRNLFAEGLVPRAQKADGQAKLPLTFPAILADPPWDVLQRSGRGAHRHYPLMTPEQIAALAVGDLVSTDAHLWLWVTNATLFAGHAVQGDPQSRLPRSGVIWPSAGLPGVAGSLRWA